MNILLTLRTLRYLKISQFIYYIRRRYIKPLTVKPVQFVEKNIEFTLLMPIVTKDIYVTNDIFKFLNIALSFQQDNVVWKNSSASRLWLYNLHYFDYLREETRSKFNKTSLIDSWIINNPQPMTPGWEPYTTSLRIVNWTFYFSIHPDEVKEHWDMSLYEQALWLEANVELHILANHYFENIKALAFAGVYFNSDDAGRWLRYAEKNIKKQLLEQTLSDGGHYERSPMYHSIMLENYLDLYNLFSSNKYKVALSTIETLKQYIEKYIHYLKKIIMPNQTLPLFNDSAHGIAPSIKELTKYAQELLNDEGIDGTGISNSLINMNDSGLYGYKYDGDMFIIDCGEIGPSYQPGHTHCDLLSYELMLNRQHIIVDTGVFEYAPGNYRAYSRSTKAHNTISVDDSDQSEIWGEFRVARRAAPKKANIVKVNSSVKFTGSYTGFDSVKSGIIHTRNVTIKLHEVTGKILSINVSDDISGSGRHRVNNYIHLHPSVSVTEIKPGLLNLMSGSVSIAILRIHNNSPYTLEQSWYFPEFGIKMENTVISLSCTGTFPINFIYSIEAIL